MSESTNENPGLNVYQRLLRAIEKIGNVHPNGRNSRGRPYFTMEQIYGIVRPVCLNCGIILIPNVVDVIHSTYETSSGTKMDMAEVRAHFRIINVDDPDDFIEANWISPGSSANYMATMGAETIAVRTWLEHLFMISADDPSPDTDNATRRSRQQQRPYQPPEPPKFDEPPDMSPFAVGGADKLRFYLSENGLTEDWLRSKLKQRGNKHEKIDHPCECWPKCFRSEIYAIVNEELEINQTRKSKSGDHS